MSIRSYLVLLSVFAPILAFSQNNEIAPGAGNAGNPSRDFGDELNSIYSLAAGGANSELVLGVAYLNGSYFITTAGDTDNAEQNYLIELDSAGNMLNKWAQPTVDIWGWRDLADDGSFLYGSNSGVIEQINPATGAPTGVTIPSPINPARGIGYYPNTDTFFVAGFGTPIYEVSRAGSVLRTIPSSHATYGLAVDGSTPAAIWAYHQDDYQDAVRFDLVTGLPSGITFRGNDKSNDPLNPDVAGGADFAELGGVDTLILVQQSQPGDYIVHYSIDPGITEIPTLGTTGLIAFLVLMAGTAVWQAKRRRIAEGR